MTELPPNSYTSFVGHQHLITGSLLDTTLAVKKVQESSFDGAILIFDNATGQTIDVDTRGSDEDISRRLRSSIPVQQESTQDEVFEETVSRGRGRPKLGVTPREVTLLPRHWEWLAIQPGGASVALRKLVEEARRASSEKDRLRKSQERAYHFMLAIAGDLSGYEEATRALFANNPERVRDLIADWPVDIRNHAMQLAFGS